MTVRMKTIVNQKNIGELWDERLKLDAEKLFMIYESKDGDVTELTYKDAYINIVKAANFFLDLDIKKGDVVAVQLFNSPEFVYVLFGLLKIGAVIVPMNIHYTSTECAYIMNKCGAGCLLIEESFLAIHEKIEGLNVRHRILARTSRAVDGYLNLFSGMSRQPHELKEKRELSPDDLAEILFTSGTTSMPKGAMFTHYNLLYAGRFHANQIGLTRDDRFFTVFPCFHIDWQAMAMMPTVSVGSTVVVQEKYHASKFWGQIRAYDITLAEAIPMIVRTLMLQPVDAEEKNHKVRLMYFSLCLSTEEKEAFEDRYRVRLFNCYGMTETVVCNVADVCTGEAKWPSVGKIYEPYELKIVDAENRTLEVQQKGEICLKGIRGRNLISGYYNDEQATCRLYDEDDWMHTGDKGYLDRDGWLYFIDRSSNLIKRSGENISSTEVENVLTSHADIEEAAVIGVPDPIREQAVKAYVRYRPGRSVGIEEIKRFCSERLAGFKVPSIIEVVDEFAHTCTGKVQKKYLH